ncbi:MAG: hypothetical protein ACK4MJ_01265 [Hylemonella sp.]
MAAGRIGRAWWRGVAAVAALAALAGSSYVLWQPQPPAAGQAAAQEDAPAVAAPATAAVVIADEAWQGWLDCAPSAALRALQDRLLATAVPLRQTASERVYGVQGTLLGLPVVEMEIGVCTSTGTRDCGWGSYTGLVIDRPLPQVRQALRAHTGSDYTEALRDEEAEATLRPLLTEAGPGRSRLHCDPGTL